MLVREPTPARGEFLGRLLNTGVYLTVLTLDPRARQLAQAEISKVTLYLDTNFLYAVLGAGGPTEAFGAKRMLELCQQLGGVSANLTVDGRRAANEHCEQPTGRREVCEIQEDGRSHGLSVG